MAGVSGIRGRPGYPGPSVSAPLLRFGFLFLLSLSVSFDCLSISLFLTCWFREWKEKKDLTVQLDHRYLKSFMQLERLRLRQRSDLFYFYRVLLLMWWKWAIIFAKGQI